jgi:hypothetical protein
MATLQTFGMTGSPAVTFPANRQPIVETLSVQVDVSPPGSKLEASSNTQAQVRTSRYSFR